MISHPSGDHQNSGEVIQVADEELQLELDESERESARATERQHVPVQFESDSKQHTGRSSNKAPLQLLRLKNKDTQDLIIAVKDM